MWRSPCDRNELHFTPLTLSQLYFMLFLLGSEPPPNAFMLSSSLLYFQPLSIGCSLWTAHSKYPTTCCFPNSPPSPSFYPIVTTSYHLCILSCCQIWFLSLLQALVSSLAPWCPWLPLASSIHLSERSSHNTNLTVPPSCLKSPKCSPAMAKKPGDWTWLSLRVNDPITLPTSPSASPCPTHPCVRTVQSSLVSSAPVLDSHVLPTKLSTLGVPGCLPACLLHKLLPVPQCISAFQHLTSGYTHNEWTKMWVKERQIFKSSDFFFSSPVYDCYDCPGCG